MSETVGAASSVYGVMPSWLTPTCLFIFINLVIGIIAITSRFANTRKKQQQLVPSLSLLERLTSFNLRHHKHEPTTRLHSMVDPVHSLDSSKLDREEDKCFNHKGEIQRPDPVQKKTESFELDRVSSSSSSSSSSFLHRVRSFSFGLCKVEIEGSDSNQQKLTRAPSLLERLKSLKFERSESVRKPQAEVTGTGEDEEEEEGVDAKADDFINRFRQQLRLQRLDSILRYRDMLKRN